MPGLQPMAMNLAPHYYVAPDIFAAERQAINRGNAARLMPQYQG